MSVRARAIHGYKMSGEQRANLEIKSQCPALPGFHRCRMKMKNNPQIPSTSKIF